MFRIKRITGSFLPSNKKYISQIKKILKEQFPLIRKKELNKLPDLLKNPLKYKFKTFVYVSDDYNRNIKSFAVMMYAPDINFCYLDYISAAKNQTGGGQGYALYKFIRNEAAELKAIGIFFECLPDDPKLCKDEKILKQNKSRLKFYERFGARPVINTLYETPLKPDDDNPPYLVFDNLNKNFKLKKEKAKLIVKAILKRKYGDICPKSYVKKVADSFNDNFIKLRDYKYIKKEDGNFKAINLKKLPSYKKIAVTVNERHLIHHVHDRGYVEAPARIKSIIKYLNKSSFVQVHKTKDYPESHIKKVHNNDFVNYLKKICLSMEESETVYPYVFPIRNKTRQPADLSMRAGYYCIDTFTPLNKNAYISARSAVNSVLTAADILINKEYEIAYSLVRPPGHHAEKDVFGGFCYFNSAAIAAEYLRAYGKIAILDIDYHHGNGQQDIFYERNDVLTISIHGHPKFAYPYFTGFEDEKGLKKGKGFNFNLPLPEKIDALKYGAALKKAVSLIKDYSPAFLITALGLDTAKGDPTGTWPLTPNDFYNNGGIIGKLKIPCLIVQEGGYDTKVLGKNANQFLKGLREAYWQV